MHCRQETCNTVADNGLVLTTAMTRVNDEGVYNSQLRRAAACCGQGTERRACVNEYNREITASFATTLIVNYMSYIKVPEKRLVVGETTENGESSDVIITL